MSPELIDQLPESHSESRVQHHQEPTGFTDSNQRIADEALQDQVEADGIAVLSIN